MNVCGNPIISQESSDDYVISNPYKLPNTSIWKVNVNKEGNPEKLTAEFFSKQECDKFLLDIKDTNQISIFSLTITDGNGNYKETKNFLTKESCDYFISKNNKEELNKIKENEISNINKDSDFLDNYIKGGASTINIFQQNNINPSTDIGEEDNRDEEELNEAEERCKSQAQKLLMSAASFYLKGKELKEDEYFSYKLQLQEQSFADILMQLDIAKKSIRNLYLSIMREKKPSAKSYDSLVSMQRFVFDVNKWQQDNLEDIQRSIKLMRDELVESGELVDDKEFTENGEEFHISDRAKFIKDVNKIIQEGKDIKTPLSPNKKLHKEGDESAGEIVELKEDVEDDDGYVDNGSGFESFEDESSDK